MKRRFLTLFLAFVMTLTLVSPVLASAEEAADGAEAAAPAEAQVGIGGLDFYSITINYTKDILVDYTYYKADKAYLFADPDTNEGVMAKSYIYRAGVTKDNCYIGYEKKTKAAGTKFFQLQCREAGIEANAQYSKYPYANAYITHIQDKAVLKSMESISFYGITDPYDDGEPYVNQNPNCIYDSDGYALDEDVIVVKNADGTTTEKNYRIDINNYRITDDYLWLDKDGRRIELFYEMAELHVTGKNKTKPITEKAYLGTYVWIPFADRFDENNKIKDVKDIVYYGYIPLKSEDWILAEDQGKDGLNQFGIDHMDTAKVSDPAIMQYKIATTKEEIETITSKSGSKKYDVVMFTPLIYKIDKGSMTDEEYYSKDTVFTGDNIQKDKDGNLVFGTPVIGNAKLNVEIESITVEIDAVGDKIYSDASQDPQNLNTVTVSLNDFAQNCILKKEALDEKRISQATFDSFESMILGTVNSKTTSTEPSYEKGTDDNKKPTTVSLKLDIDPDTLKAIPRTAYVYLTFGVQTHQPESSYDESKLNFDKSTGKTTLVIENVDLYEKPEKQAPVISYETDLGATIALIGGISAAVIAAIVAVVIIVVKKKKKKAA